MAKKLGANHLVNYRKSTDWATQVLQATDGTGVDLVVDVVGAASIEQSLKATRYGGAVVSVGLLSEDPTQKINIMQDVLFGAKTIQGMLGAGSMEQLSELARFMDKH